jgi:hypothetical protein
MSSKRMNQSKLKEVAWENLCVQVFIYLDGQ